MNHIKEDQLDTTLLIPIIIALVIIFVIGAFMLALFSLIFAIIPMDVTEKIRQVVLMITPIVQISVSGMS